MNRVMVIVITGAAAAERVSADKVIQTEDQGRGDHAQERVRPVEEGQEQLRLEFTSARTSSRSMWQGEPQHEHGDDGMAPMVAAPRSRPTRRPALSRSIDFPTLHASGDVTGTGLDEVLVPVR